MITPSCQVSDSFSSCSLFFSSPITQSLKNLIIMLGCCFFLGDRGSRLWVLRAILQHSVFIMSFVVIRAKTSKTLCDRKWWELTPCCYNKSLSGWSHCSSTRCVCFPAPRFGDLCFFIHPMYAPFLFASLLPSFSLSNFFFFFFWSLSKNGAAKWKPQCSVDHLALTGPTVVTEIQLGSTS